MISIWHGLDQHLQLRQEVLRSLLELHEHQAALLEHRLAHQSDALEGGASHQTRAPRGAYAKDALSIALSI